MVSRLSDWFYKPETACHENIGLKIKSIVMRTINNLFRKVHNYIRFKGDLLSLNENVKFWRFFLIFNILNVFVQSPKSSTGTSISPKSLTPR